ncbi:heparan-alpha-glucosaminide N-acetyltransferase [Chelativorans sp. Marseille-P2723]|uniref:DUF1624 domain-containing protein n=1 Tax=Chelativorans sp. Marseille-P2723 TaxID=2709133 RepID=UPI001FF06B85|nr:heparan-alpha-glucosaminide N-acetyltransferase [Chelativorans sp. Marseille-P2723]
MQARRLSRIELIDAARGAALVAMAIYHFTWDLGFFGYIEPTIPVTGGWRIFARCIASSFLFLVGVSLFLAHGHGIRWRSFGKRLAMIAGAALAITVVTYYATPDAFIFFGILHHIALASILGLAVMRLPVFALVILAGAVIAASRFIQASLLDQPLFWWTGLSRNVPPSNDYIPIFPWFGMVLLGIAAAKWAASTGILARLASVRPHTLPLLAAAGRHSLLFYLLHQPVLIALLWTFAQVLPPATPDRTAIFLDACTERCSASREERFCRTYCACVVDAAAADDRVEALFSPRPDAATQEWLEEVVFRCSLENNGRDGEISPSAAGRGL